jgi:hypothetical protein
LWWLQRINFAADLCFLQRTSFAAKLCCLHQIRFRCRMVLPTTKEFLLPNYIVCNESAFTTEIAFSTANLCLLLKLCVYRELAFAAQNCVCLQWISVRSRKCVFSCEYVIRCQNWVVCSKLAFAAESVCSVVNLWFAAEIELSAMN